LRGEQAVRDNKHLPARRAVSPNLRVCLAVAGRRRNGGWCAFPSVVYFGRWRANLGAAISVPSYGETFACLSLLVRHCSGRCGIFRLRLPICLAVAYVLRWDGSFCAYDWRWFGLPLLVRRCVAGSVLTILSAVCAVAHARGFMRYNASPAMALPFLLPCLLSRGRFLLLAGFCSFRRGLPWYLQTSIRHSLLIHCGNVRHFTVKLLRIFRTRVWLDLHRRQGGRRSLAANGCGTGCCGLRRQNVLQHGAYVYSVSRLPLKHLRF